MPIYVLTHTIENGGTPTQERRLVDAKNQAQAIGHIVTSSIVCAVASSADLIECTKAGIDVEKAT